MKLGPSVVTRAVKKKNGTGSSAQSAPFCPHVILLSVHPSERWMVGAVGIELKATLKTRKLLILLNVKNGKNTGFAQPRYTAGTRGLSVHLLLAANAFSFRDSFAVWKSCPYECRDCWLWSATMILFRGEWTQQNRRN